MTPTERYLEKFGQKFPNRIAEVIDDFGSPIKNDVKAFIASCLEQQRQEMIEMVKAERTVEAKVKWGKIKVWSSELTLGYNAALDAVLAKLKEEK